MAFAIRAALESDAPAIGTLANQFASYLRSLGDRTDFKLTAEAYFRDGFGLRPAFEGLVAEEHGCVIGYLLYHFGYDSDGAFRNLPRKQGVGRGLMMAAAAVARASDAREMTWSVYHANDLACAFYGGLGSQKITDLFFMRLPSDTL